MRCPKCGYISFDNQAACAKCAHDLLPLAQQLQGTVTKDPPPAFLAAALAGSEAAGGEIGEEILIDEQGADEAAEALDELLVESAAEPQEEAAEEGGVASEEPPAEETATEIEMIPVEAAAPAATPAEEPAGSEDVDLGTLDLGDLGDLDDLLPATEAPTESPAAADEVMDLDSLLDLGQDLPVADEAAPAPTVSDDLVLTLDTDEAPLGGGAATPEAPPEIADLGLALESEDDK